MKNIKEIGLLAAGALLANPVFADDSISPITVANEENLKIGVILVNITNWVLGFSAAVAVLFLIIGGLQYVTASGNEKRADAAKKTILYAVIGLVVILLAYLVVGFLKQNITSFIN